MRNKTVFVATMVALLGMVPDPAASAELKIGVRSETVSLDPHFSLQPPDMQIGRHFFDNLIFFDENQQMIPGLARSWTQIDDKTWEFKLRKDVKWQDGSPFTADDVVFTFSREGNIEGSANSPLRFLTAGRKSAKKVDDYTVRVTTEETYVLTPEDIAIFGIVSKKHGEGASSDDYNSGKALIGSGPYKFVEWTRGDRLVMEANPNYWNGRPTWDRITIKPIKSGASRVAALLNGDVDLIDYVPVADIETLKKRDDIAVHFGASNRSIYIVMDSSRDVSPFVKTKDGKPMVPNPLRDYRVRKAISMALDRNALVDRVMEGAGIPASQLLPDGFFGTSNKLKVQPYDLPGAKKLLEQAGYGDGFSLTFHGPNDRYPNDTKIAQTIAQMLSRLNIDVKIETMPRSVYFPKSRGFNFSFGLWGYSTDTGEVGSWINNVLACYNREAGRGNANVGRYCNQRLDSTLLKALSETDEGKRRSLLELASEIAVNDVALIPLYYQVNVWASRKGLTYNPRSDEYTLSNDVKPTN